MKKIILKGIIVATMMLLSTVSAFAGGAEESSVTEAEKILIPFTTLENDYFKMWWQGASEAAEALGCEAVQATNEGNTEKQVSQIETMISSGINMIMNCSPDSSNIVAIAKMAQNGKAWFVNNHESPDWLTPPSIGDYYVAINFADNFGYGYQMAKLLFDEIGGKGKILHISGWPGNLPDKLRTMGLQKALEEYPEIELLASQPGKWNRVDSRKVMEDFIIAYPDFDGVFCQNDDVGIGAMVACEESGIHVPITGIDGNKGTMEYIKEGRYFAVMSQHPGWHAGWATVMAWDAAHGWKPTAAERMLQFDGTIITKENVDWYYDLMWGEDKLPFDWKKMSKVLHPDDWDPQNRVKPLDPRKFWEGNPMPTGYTLPAEYGAAYEEIFKKVEKSYAEHYSSKMLHPF